MLILGVLRNENVPVGNGPMGNAREQDVCHECSQYMKTTLMVMIM